MTLYSNYVECSARWDQSGDQNLLTILGLSAIRGVSAGRGVLYYWLSEQGRGSMQTQFDMLQVRPLEYSTGDAGQTIVGFGAGDMFPCSGIMTGSDVGYLIAPAVEIVIDDSHHLALMFLSPAATARQIILTKTALAVPGSSDTVALSTENNEIRCSGTISGGFKKARIVLNRNPGLSIYKEGFNQTLCEVQIPGEIKVAWKPVGRSFEQRLLVFDPIRLTYTSIMDLIDTLEAGNDDDEFFSDYVIGDGVGVNYAVRLVLDRGLGRHFFDEAQIRIV